MTEKKKKIDYAEFRRGLIAISNLTEAQLNDKLKGRQKYDPVTLEPLPFEGISLIHNIEKEKARQLRLSEMAQKFKNDLGKAGVKNKVAFVDLDSFHATTFDLVNEVEHSQLIEAKNYRYKSAPDGSGGVREAVEIEARRFVNEIGPKLSAKVTIESIGMFAPEVVKLNLTFNKVVENVFQAYRVELNKHLIDNVDGYLAVRKASWDQKLSAHITFGYVVNSMTEGEIDSFLGVMKAFNGEFQSIEFDLSQGEITQFVNMNSYSPI
jgi:hypothetical protein